MARLAIFVMSLLVALATPVAGHRQSLSDPDDSPGPLDIRAVKNRDEKMGVATSHPADSWWLRELRFRVTTFEAWEASVLEGEFNFIAIEILRPGDSGNRIGGDVCFYIEPRGERYLQGRMYETCWPSPADPKGRWRNVLRPDEYSAKAVFPRKLIKKGVRSYRWRFATSFEEGSHPDCAPSEQMPPEKIYGTCVDFTEWRRHRM